MTRVVVFGTGALAELMDFHLSHDSPHEVVAFTSTEPASGEFLARPVVAFEGVQDAYPPGEHAMFVAVGYRERNRLRSRFHGEAKARGYELVSYVSSRALHWDPASVGDNCAVFEGATVEPFATLGDDVVLWAGAHVGHHSTVADHCFLAPCAVLAGFVSAGERVFVGVNATVRDGVSLGEGALVAAGAAVLRDVAPDEVYLGE
jgi:sugar O-acyltransferase (sialic acid O-acetyltransferase NeuD family)